MEGGMDQPYFSLNNLAFQTPGSDIETRLNRDKAFEVLKAYVHGNGNSQDAAFALKYLSDNYPR
jgi:hypothetical protein